MFGMKSMFKNLMQHLDLIRTHHISHTLHRFLFNLDWEKPLFGENPNAKRFIALKKDLQYWESKYYSVLISVFDHQQGEMLLQWLKMT